jgi:NAD+ synthase (glutamine-hydrolysing)
MSEQLLVVAVAQVACRVGAIASNTQKILDHIAQAQSNGASVVVFPELTICGYSVEDLLLFPAFQQAVDQALIQISQAVGDIVVIVGHPLQENGLRYNAASVIYQGRILHQYRKQRLPNTEVFDEVRYFVPGEETLIFDVKGHSVGLLICEDGWHPQVALAAQKAGATLLIQLNASPFHIHKHQERLNVMRKRVAETKLPCIYVNLVAGQDEIIFDGGSFALSAEGEVTHQAPFFEEALMLVSYGQSVVRAILPMPSPHALLYQALVFALREYVTQNRFPGVIIGLSGGIDSAVTLAIAVDALGANHVRTVAMPSRYTADISNLDAAAQAKQLGVQHDQIAIEPMVNSFLTGLQQPFAGLSEDVTEENIQARCRGVILMALSNKTGWMVLPTGNKSELAVGYCTLYGDMVGGFDVLKDVLKTQVYALAEYRSRQFTTV